jgi:hypothetical protein
MLIFLGEDLHTKNACYALAGIKNSTVEDILHRLGDPYILPLARCDGRPRQVTIPEYTVRPASFQETEGELKIVDFGQGQDNHRWPYQN